MAWRKTLAETFARYGHTNWFAFDMAVPDMRSYLNANLITYTRLSDVEPSPAWLEQAAGVWLDGFEGEWFSNRSLAIFFPWASGFVWCHPNCTGVVMTPCGSNCSSSGRRTV